MKNETDRNSTQGISVAWWTGALVGAVLLYPLSAGPAVFLYALLEHSSCGPAAMTVLVAVYFPLEWLCEEFEAFSVVLTPYVAFWRQLAGNP